MFEAIKTILSGTSLIKRSYEETFEMMELVSQLYDEACALLFDGTQPSLDIHKEDKRVNHMEMKIRADILRHLSVSPQREVGAALVLSSVVGYIERVGDYTKNIEELALMYRRPLRGCKAAAELLETAEALGANIKRTRQAFAEEDKATAIEIIKLHKRVRKVSDRAMEAAFASKEVSQEALVCAMLARYVKRISAGLKNVCTAVVAPFDQIGYSRQLDLEE